MSMPEAEIGRKASILSILSTKYEEERTVSSLGRNPKEPKDSFHLVHITCFLLGFMTVVPMLFFNTAAGYWMYKFRDPSLGSEPTSGSDRTTLQVYFQSCSIVAGNVPNIALATIWTVYGHKISAMKRTLVSLLLFVVLYLIFTVFTEINTDSWQTGFFVLTVSLLVINSALTATMQMSTAMLMAKLPQEYLLYYLLGQNGTFLTTILQLIALSSTDNQTTTGMVYFSAGSFIIVATLTLLLLSRRTKMFQHYEVEVVNKVNSETITWADAKVLIKQIWPSLLMSFILFHNGAAITPAITTLVVSQDEASHTQWTDKFFTPICVFLIPEATSLIGRILSKKALITESNKWWYVIVTVARLLLTVPMALVFNAQPRNSITAVLDKDWEFIIFTAFMGLTTGWLLNICFMSLKSLAPGKQEQSLKILTLSLSVAIATSFANGILMVKALLL